MKRIDVLIDASGSMNEEGKMSALKYLLYAMKNIIKEYGNENVCVEFVQWSTEITRIEKFNMLIAKGELNENCLSEYYRTKFVDGVIFVSDGLFNMSLRSPFLNISKTIFVVSVGLDSDDYNLKMLASDSFVYKAYDIEQVIKKCLFME